MTRSSTSELFTPYKEHEREFRSSRKHFKTLSLDELRSPNFNLLSGQEYSEEEVAETMAETIEQYMSKTRANYGSGLSSMLRHSYVIDWAANLLAKKNQLMEEINNFQQEPDENLYQAWERFKELLMKCPQHYLINMQEVILFYNGLGIPTQQILDSRGAILSKTAADAKKKENPEDSLTTRNLVDLFKEGDIEQQLQDSIKGTMRILQTKNEGNLWKIP
ncbi:hypothetical protein Tco_1154010 [Tanacetum coccineum]